MDGELDLTALEALSPQERELALKMLGQFSDTGKSQLFEDELYRDFAEVPVDIETFIKDRRYLGNGLTDAEGRFTVFPFWVDTLKRIFPTNVDTAYNTLILTGSIGIGKSATAVLCMLYMLYRMMCLKDPYVYYGMQPIDRLSFSLINISLDSAKGVAWDKMQQLLQSSPWFMEHGKVTGKDNLVWHPKKRKGQIGNIEIVLGSKNNHIIGRAIFCLDGDTEIATTKGVCRIADLVGKSVNVLSYDGAKAVVSSECTVLPTIKTDEEYQIELEDGTAIKCTPNHKLMLKDGTYEEARYLTEGDELSDLDGTWRIHSVKKVNLPEPKQFYDVIEAHPYHNFLIKTNGGFVVSHNCSFTDEVNFSAVTSDKDKIKKKQLGLISQTEARMLSRFLRGTYLPTLQIIASSKDSEQSFLESYIAIKKKNNSETTLIIDEPQWVVDSRKDSPVKFHVAIGDKYHASEVLPVDTDEATIRHYRDNGYRIIDVPYGPYYESFCNNVDIALTDIAGISTEGARKYISGAKWKAAKTEDYQNPFTQDVLEIGNGEKDESNYWDFFDMSKVDKSMMSKPMFIHMDLSKDKDKTGIAGVWILGKRRTPDGEGEENGLQYKVAFSVSIKAPKGYEISFEKNFAFVLWLKKKGFRIKGISFDQFQSVYIQQRLKAAKFEVSQISVDRLERVDGSKQMLCRPYDYFHTALYEGRVMVYDLCDLLTKEVVELEREPDGRINHPEDGKYGSKDQIDAVVGAMYNASLHVEEYVHEYGEKAYDFTKLNDQLDAESVGMRQMMVNYEEELKKAGFTNMDGRWMHIDEGVGNATKVYDSIPIL